MDWFFENFKIIQWLVWGIFGAIVWALAVTFTKKKDHAGLISRVNKIELTYSSKDAHTSLAERVNTLESQVKEMPDKTTIHRVESEMKQLKGQLDGVEKLLSHISNQVGMLVENEITGSK
ncbi:DUF2730 family protein [Thalassomonas viridans]|uniref:DUF2730 family protein n=1 Tax=Thalassomonas viridans TaxID=137584 RepID=A0AAE9Z792_9GAMM|nr:DUF2730 family protein [Thalassomonas viridans]WDE07279.1 DUF2730 family protein [Thalassomonas viridans]